MSQYDQMQVCLNGHYITDRALRSPEFRRKFCNTCGAATIDSCPACHHPIRGDYIAAGVLILGYTTPVPSYCDNCGAVYPWRAAAIENLKEVLREGDLSDQDVADAEATFPDVLRETPKTESASLKLGRVLKRLGKPTYDVAIKVVSDLASETAKKTMGL